MIDHHLQREIVYKLSQADSLRFSDLKPDDIENKLFDYHLKKVMSARYVTKDDAGMYVLTPLGRRVGKDALRKDEILIDRAYSVLFLAVRRAEDNAWLLCRRKTHPLLHRVGFVHAQPELGVSVFATAQQTLANKTGLQADFAVRGSGYLRMYEHDNLESFTNFTLLEATQATGELEQLDELAEYYWQKAPDFTDPALLPSISMFAEQLAKPGLFFVEKTFKQ